MKPVTRSPIQRMIDASCKCVRCGAGIGLCNCWVRCACGWTYARGEECRNEVHRCAATREARCCLVVGHAGKHDNGTTKWKR